MPELSEKFPGYEKRPLSPNRRGVQKKKHRKRRLFNRYTFKIINSIIRKDGFFHFSTDNINYALEARDIIREVTKSEINFS